MAATGLFSAAFNTLNVYREWTEVRLQLIDIYWHCIAATGSFNAAFDTLNVYGEWTEVRLQLIDSAIRRPALL